MTTANRRDESTESEPAIGAESVPGYRDLARIGHGGFSVVYRAVQESFERAVALKVLTVGPGEDARGRFLREVRLAGRLSGHPHVVTVLDTGTTGSGRPYLAMDLYDGGSMKQRLVRSGPLSAPETALVGAKIAEALAAAHALGVLHRDVKPNNILISRFGEPALADFGVSCLLDSSSSASVLDVFSPQHAAPELMTRGTPSASCDVYALGSTLYELLTGQPPFGGDGRDVRALMWQALTEPAPRPQCPDLPELADAILRALAKEPEDRFADAAEFARVLRALIPDGVVSTLLIPAAGPDRSSTGSNPTLGDPLNAFGPPGSLEPASLDSLDSLDSAPPDQDATSYRRAFAADETRMRPDRNDDGAAARRPSPADPAEQRGSARLRRPLLLAGVLVLLLGGVGWAVYASLGSPTAGTDAAAAHHPTVIPTADAVHTSARPRPTTPGASAPRHSTAPAAPAAVTSSKASIPATTAPAASPASSSSGSLLSILGTYYRFENQKGGDCLAQDSGSSASTAACGSGAAEGWEYSVPITGLLSAPVSGQFELVNEASGDCLTGGSGGAVSARSCDGGTGQLWTKSSETSSVTELKNAADGECLESSGGAVAEAGCSTGDTAQQWSQSGSS